MGNIVFKLRYHLQDSGDIDKAEDGIERPLRMEVQNDAKFLLSYLNTVDTAKEPFKSRRRTIMRLFAAVSKVTRELARLMKTADIPDDEEDFIIDREIPISPEGFEFLKEMIDNPPEGVKFSTIPVQSLLVSIDDQHAAWKREETGVVKVAKTPEPEAPA
jgi:hypothetical protein